MKLATLKDSTRDGRLVVVSKDLTRCSEVGHIARTLQAAFDDWAHVGPRLARVAQGIETGSQPTLRFHEHDAAAPLPRAFHRIDGSGASIRPASSDGFSGPRDAISLSPAANVHGGIAVVVDDIAKGASADEARDAIRLVMLFNDVSLGSAADDQSRPVSTFSPVAVSPDELGDAWKDGWISLPVQIGLNNTPHSQANTGKATIDLGSVVAQAAKHRALAAGTIVNAGVSEGTTSLKPGDTVRIEMKDKASHSIFGAIEQKLG